LKDRASTLNPWEETWQDLRLKYERLERQGLFARHISWSKVLKQYDRSKWDIEDEKLKELGITAQCIFEREREES
jgi:hypothetical protein